MTSELNYLNTKKYIKENNYFNIEMESIFVFNQVILIF